MPIPVPSNPAGLIKLPARTLFAPVVRETCPRGCTSRFNETYETSDRAAKATAALAGRVTTRTPKFLNFLMLLPPDVSRAESIEDADWATVWTITWTDSKPLPPSTFFRISFETLLRCSGFEGDF